MGDNTSPQAPSASTSSTAGSETFSSSDTQPSVVNGPSAAATSSSTPTHADSASPSSVDVETLARQKREARKARILSKGSDRLARITSTGRGQGASAYLDPSTPLGLSRPSSALSAPSPAAGDGDPVEVDVSTLPTIGSDQATRREAAAMDNLFRMGGGGGGVGGGMGGQGNPMEALMAMMQGQGGPFGGAGDMGGAGGDGAQGFPGMEGLPPQLAAMLQGMQGSGRGGDGSGGASQQAPPTVLRTKTLPERLFDVLQAGLVVLLALYFARSSLFNQDHSSSFAQDVAAASSLSTSASSSTLQRWARLGYEQPLWADWTPSFAPTGLSGGGAGSSYPLFWIFIALETALQAMRIVLFSNKQPPPPPSMLGMLVNFVPIPNFAIYVRLLGKYAALANAFVNDLAVVVFVFGLAVLWAGWQVGIDGVAPMAGRRVKDEL